MAADSNNSTPNVIILLPFILIFSALGVYITIIVVRAFSVCLKEGKPSGNFLFSSKSNQYEKENEIEYNKWLETRSEPESVSPAIIWSPERIQWERQSTPMHTPLRMEQQQQKFLSNSQKSTPYSKPSKTSMSPNIAIQRVGSNDAFVSGHNLPSPNYLSPVPMSIPSLPHKQGFSFPNSPSSLTMMRQQTLPPPMPKPSIHHDNTINSSKYKSSPGSSKIRSGVDTSQIDNHKPANQHDNALHRGVLHRKTAKLIWKSSWIPRNCVLYESGLFTCLGRGGTIKLQIEIHNCVVRYLKRLNNKSHVFTLTPRNSLNASRDQVVFAAPSLAQAEEWQHCFRLLSVDQA